MKSFDGLMPIFLHQSLTTGMNIATTGVLLINALTMPTGTLIRS